MESILFNRNMHHLTVKCVLKASFIILIKSMKLHYVET